MICEDRFLCKKLDYHCDLTHNCALKKLLTARGDAETQCLFCVRFLWNSEDKNEAVLPVNFARFQIVFKDKMEDM